MTSDYDKIFYFDANKNLYKGSFYWKYLQFQLKKNTVLLHGMKLTAAMVYIKMGKLCVTSAKRVVDSGNNLTALVSEILRYLLVSRELHVIPKLQYRFCKTTHSLENLENKTFVVCILLSPQEWFISLPGPILLHTFSCDNPVLSHRNFML